MTLSKRVGRGQNKITILGVLEIMTSLECRGGYRLQVKAILDNVNKYEVVFFEGFPKLKKTWMLYKIIVRKQSLGGISLTSDGGHIYCVSCATNGSLFLE